MRSGADRRCGTSPLLRLLRSAFSRFGRWRAGSACRARSSSVMASSAYIVGVTLIKMPLYHFVVERVLRPRLSNPALAGTQGVCSAASELSAAAAFFVYVIPELLAYWQLVGFGVGAGAVEAIMLPVSFPIRSGAVTLGEHAEEVFRASARAQGVQWLSVLERIWAMLLQVE